MALNNKETPVERFFQVRWGGLEPPRLAAHGPQPCLSASSSTSAKLRYYNRGRMRVKQIMFGFGGNL